MTFVLAMEFSRGLERPATARSRSSLTTDFGGHSGGVTPVPIPNTAVKPTRADGTWGETPWESRSPPDFSSERGPSGPRSSFWRPSEPPGCDRYAARCPRARAPPSRRSGGSSSASVGRVAAPASSTRRSSGSSSSARRSTSRSAPRRASDGRAGAPSRGSSSRGLVAAGVRRARAGGRAVARPVGLARVGRARRAVAPPAARARRVGGSSSRGSSHRAGSPRRGAARGSAGSAGRAAPSSPRWTTGRWRATPSGVGLARRAAGARLDEGGSGASATWRQAMDRARDDRGRERRSPPHRRVGAGRRGPRRGRARRWPVAGGPSRRPSVRPRRARGRAAGASSPGRSGSTRAPRLEQRLADAGRGPSRPSATATPPGSWPSWSTRPRAWPPPASSTASRCTGRASGAPPIKQLEAFRLLTGSTEQHPVLADCYRALGEDDRVDELWGELRAGLAQRRAGRRGAHRGGRACWPTAATSPAPSGCSNRVGSCRGGPSSTTCAGLRPGRPLRAGRRHEPGARAVRPVGPRRRPTSPTWWPRPGPGLSATGRVAVTARGYGRHARPLLLPPTGSPMRLG